MTHQTCLKQEEFREIHGCPSPPDCGGCMDSGCRCCQFWMGILCDAVGAGNAEKEKLQTLVTSLEEKNAGHVKANCKLSAHANGIHISQTKKKANPGKAGRKITRLQSTRGIPR